MTKTYKAFMAENKLSVQDLEAVEKFADKLFGHLNIDVEFTKHFIARVNDSRNKKDITTAELIRLFKQAFKKYGKTIKALAIDTQAVIQDLQTNINLPFVLVFDKKNNEFDMVAKTILRKQNFQTPNRKLKI